MSLPGNPKWFMFQQSKGGDKRNLVLRAHFTLTEGPDTLRGTSHGFVEEIQEWANVGADQRLKSKMYVHLNGKVPAGWVQGMDIIEHVVHERKGEL